VPVYLINPLDRLALLVQSTFILAIMYILRIIAEFKNTEFVVEFLPV
jgi:hypothetical protein